MFGCVSLKEVNQYTASSITSLHKINDLNYDFSDYCQRDCELKQLRAGQIDTLYVCSCEGLATKADEAIQQIHSTITSYLDAIHQLSDNKPFVYNVSNLTGALQENPLLNLSSDQVNVYTKAGNFIATAATAFYRKKKLSLYLQEADPVFQDLTETFIFLIGRLKSQLRTDYDLRMTNIYQMKDNNQNKDFRQMLVKLFLDERAYYKKHDARIDSYITLLQTVKKGHHELYLQRDDLKNHKIKELIKHYSEDIQDIVAHAH